MQKARTTIAARKRSRGVKGEHAALTPREIEFVRELYRELSDPEKLSRRVKTAFERAFKGGSDA